LQPPAARPLVRIDDLEAWREIVGDPETAYLSVRFERRCTPVLGEQNEYSLATEDVEIEPNLVGITCR
jgi:hypothetical protein